MFNEPLEEFDPGLVRNNIGDVQPIFVRVAMIPLERIVCFQHTWLVAAQKRSEERVIAETEKVSSVESEFAGDES